MKNDLTNTHIPYFCARESLLHPHKITKISAEPISILQLKEPHWKQVIIISHKASNVPQYARLRTCILILKPSRCLQSNT